jgi:hypothetical protein
MSDYTIQTQIQELKQEQQASKVQLANIEAAIHKLELMLIESDNKHSLTELKVSNLESSITNISLDTRSIRNSVISGIILATIIGLTTMAISTFRTEPPNKTIIKTSTSLLTNMGTYML